MNGQVFEKVVISTVQQFVNKFNFKKQFNKLQRNWRLLQNVEMQHVKVMTMCFAHFKKEKDKSWRQFEYSFIWKYVHRGFKNWNLKKVVGS